MDKSAQSNNGSTDLYAKAEKIYPKRVTGLYSELRLVGAWLLLGFYYVMPWINWKGQQAVLFDLPARKFRIFEITLWPHDLFFLTWLLIIAALSLFFFTALFGRVWCGYACPQTVWTKVFIWMERLWEGDRNQRIKLDKAPLSKNKFVTKAGKHTMWVLFALATGFTFVGFFTPIRELAGLVWHLQTGPWETFWILFYALATYGNAGWLREQVCIYMCPYARFQSAMFDKDTMVIGYNEERGDPRGSRKRNTPPHVVGLGDCIDCRLCVQVCPTGIDIRDGLNYKCISCGSCIDVCDQVMNEMNYPMRLVSYTSENEQAKQPVRLLRPRTYLYGTLLALLTVGFFYALFSRVPLELDVIRDRGRLFEEVDNGYIENVYTLKILNMDTRKHVYRLTAKGIEGLTIRGKDEYTLGGGELLDVPLRLSAPPESIKGKNTEVFFTLKADDDEYIHVTEKARFLGPR